MVWVFFVELLLRMLLQVLLQYTHRNRRCSTKKNWGIFRLGVIHGLNLWPLRGRFIAQVAHLFSAIYRRGPVTPFANDGFGAHLATGLSCFFFWSVNLYKSRVWPKKLETYLFHGVAMEITSTCCLKGFGCVHQVFSDDEKYWVVVSIFFWKRIQFDQYFFRWVETTNYISKTFI